MRFFLTAAPRAALVFCVMLSSCAAAGPGQAAGAVNGDEPYGPFLAARFAGAQNDPSSAAQFYGLALNADPNNQKLLSEGFLTALLAGSPLATELSARVPENALAQMLRGNDAAIAGHFAQAGSSFEALPRVDLAGLMRPLLVAWAQAGAGDSQGAIMPLQQNFKNGPFGEVFLLNAALIADAGGDKKTAATLYAQIDPSQPDLRLAQILGSWQARQGNTQAAEQALDAVAEAHPDLAPALPALRAQLSQPVIANARQGMAEAYLTVAGALTQPSQSFLRTTFLRFALALRPDLTAARLLLAGTLATPANPKRGPTPIALRDALSVLQPVTADDPLYAPALVQRAGLLSANGQPQDAVAALDTLLASAPHDVALLATAGDILREAKNFTAAQGYYQRAIDAAGTPQPGTWSLYFDRGICEDQAGNWPAAQADMLLAKQLAPGQPYLLNYLGYSWALRGERLAEAQAMLQRAVGLDPHDGALIDSLGFVHLKEGQTKQALELLTEAVELTPDDAEVNAHLGDAFWQAGQKLQADYQWQRALALNPDPPLRASISQKLQQYFPPPA